MLTKITLRKEIRNRKSEYSAAQLAEMSEMVCEKLLAHPVVSNAETVLAYWSLPDEVCTHELVVKLAALGKTVLLPKVISDTQMTLHCFTSLEDMKPGPFGILEPTTPEVKREEWDRLLQDNGVGIIPGVAFDRQCNRLGRGKGYYDRLLKETKDMYKIGACFTFQYLDKIPSDVHDIRMNEVICI